MHAGFSKSKALLTNFMTALAAVLGTIITFWISGSIENIEKILIPIAAGGFIYIASSDIIPELHKETKIWKSILQLISILVGIAVMALLIFLE